MTPELAVRPAQAGDEGLLHDVAEATFWLSCPESVTEENCRRYIADHLSVDAFRDAISGDRHEVFIATSGGVAVGYAMVVRPPGPGEVKVFLRAWPSLELSKLYVREDFHGTGVARSLLDRVTECARTEGLGSVWLGVNVANHRANRFYDRTGFEVVGRRVFQLGDAVENDVVREKLL